MRGSHYVHQLLQRLLRRSTTNTDLRPRLYWLDIRLASESCCLQAITLWDRIQCESTFVYRAELTQVRPHVPDAGRLSMKAWKSLNSLIQEICQSHCQNRGMASKQWCDALFLAYLIWQRKQHNQAANATERQIYKSLTGCIMPVRLRHITCSRLAQLLNCCAFSMLKPLLHAGWDACYATEFTQARGLLIVSFGACWYLIGQSFTVQLHLLWLKCSNLRRSGLLNVYILYCIHQY